MQRRAKRREYIYVVVVVVVVCLWVLGNEPFWCTRRFVYYKMYAAWELLLKDDPILFGKAELGQGWQTGKFNHGWWTCIRIYI